MLVSINLNPEAAEMAAAIMECQLVEPEQADWSLVFYLTSSGGTSDPTMIHKPENTTVIVGPYSSDAYAFAEAARERGVSPDHIFFLPPGPLEQDKFKTVIGATITERKSKIIGFVSEKGGTGKTTLAAALTYHYLHYDLNAMLLDICPVLNAHYHLTEQVFHGSIDSLGEYKNQRIMVDASTGFRVASEGLFDGIG